MREVSVHLQVYCFSRQILSSALAGELPDHRSVGLLPLKLPPIFSILF